MHTSLRPALVALTLLTIVAACGSAGPAGSQPATEGGVRKAARAASEAHMTGKATDAYDYLSNECQERWTREAWAKEVLRGRVLVGTFVGPVSELEVGEARVLEFSPERAKVSVSMIGYPDEGDGDEGEIYIYQRDGWRTTECESVEEANPELEFDQGG